MEFLNISASQQKLIIVNHNPSITLARHLFLCRGAKVCICDNEIILLTEPAVERCPFVESFYGVSGIDEEAVRRIVRYKVDHFGFCSPKRKFIREKVVIFGSSEIISACMRLGLIDAAVIVCDGAGTVVATDAELVQGIGSIMNGVLETSPIKEVISYISSHGGEVLDPENASIDQINGVRHAISIGFKRIAVTVIGPNSHIIPKLRSLPPNDVTVIIFSTCNTVVGENEVKFLKEADIVCASASQTVREKIGPKALIQLGVTIPVFVLTDIGKRLVLAYIQECEEPLLISRVKMPFILEDKQPVLRRKREE
ncbi:MAG TPA: DUF2099 family protein [Candidatus Bathyarchaeota archaeon]|nr:DUF2099 family protein [Candidatus Bathyarchaeota archaeon]